MIRGGGAGRRALEEVFAARYGRPDVLGQVVFHGATDRAILRQALGELDDARESVIDAILADYVAALPRWVAQSGYTAHDGVIPLLEALRPRARVAVGLGTGNVEPAARIKLAPAGLNGYFAFGGFGSDAEDRAELLEHGARRGAERLGVTRERCRVIVIGDTVRDVVAAHAIGATCVGVATGGSTVAELEAAGAERVVTTLADLAVADLLELS